MYTYWLRGLEVLRARLSELMCVRVCVCVFVFAKRPGARVRSHAVQHASCVILLRLEALPPGGSAAEPDLRATDLVGLGR